MNYDDLVCDALIKNKQIGRIYKRISLSPYLFGKKEYRDIQSATLAIARILNKTINLFQVNKDVKDFFGYDEKMIGLMSNFYLKENIFLSRFDGYLNKDKNIKFLEFNADYPGSIIRLDAMHELVYDYLGIKNYDKNNVFLNKFINIAKKVCKEKGDGGLFVIGFGSWKSKEKMYTLRFLKEQLSKENINVDIGQWKDIKNKNNELYLRDKKIDIIFRAELSDRIINLDFKDYKKILASVKANKVFVYNPTSTILVGSKSVMALWHEDFFQKLITKKEKLTIKQFIPETLFISDKTKNKIMKNKDKFVLKPVFGFGGKGIIIGKNTSLEEWETTVSKNVNKQKYICQEYIDPLEMDVDILKLDNGKLLKNKKAKININPWYCNGEVIGISGRFANCDIINISKGGGALPVYYKN